MTQKIINVGTVANDGTGDTIRGAFTNVNANFSEVYGNITNLTVTLAGMDLGQNTTITESYNTANAAFDKANSANLLAYNVGISANLYSIDVGAAGNLFASSVGTSANLYSQSVASSGNSYASILAANNAVGANAWANAVGTAGNNWTTATFITQSNSAPIYITANAAFGKANVALANTTGTFSGNLTVTGTIYSPSGFSDNLGAIREKIAVTVDSDAVINATQSIIISNSSSTINVKIPDDKIFQYTANVGTKIEVYQYGSGTTTIAANDVAVTILSSNNWSNIAGQYLTVSLLKVLPNTWMLTGNLKA